MILKREGTGPLTAGPHVAGKTMAGLMEQEERGQEKVPPCASSSVSPLPGDFSGTPGGSLFPTSLHLPGLQEAPGQLHPFRNSALVLGFS